MAGFQKRFHNAPPTPAIIVQDAEGLFYVQTTEVWDTFFYTPDEAARHAIRNNCIIDLPCPLPCPCCGGDSYYTPSNHRERMDGAVECAFCGLKMEEDHDNDAPGTALLAWNRRVA